MHFTSHISTKDPNFITLKKSQHTRFSRNALIWFLLVLIYCFMYPHCLTGFCGVFVSVCITLCPFQFFNHLDKEERAGCFAFLSFGSLVTIHCIWLFLTVPWVCLQCVFS